MRRTSLIALFLVSLGWAQASEPSTESKLADLAMTQIQCATFSSYIKQERFQREGKKLVEAGINNLRTFLTAVEMGRITEQDLYSEVPMIVSMELRGGWVSKEFLAGRIYQSIMTDAADKVHEYKSIEHFGEFRDVDLWPIEAENLYSQGNCSLLVP